MSSIVDRGIYDNPILFVNEQNHMNVYTRNYTTNGLSYFVPPEGKNLDKLRNFFEVIFLPIKKEEFENNKDSYFFGFRFLIVIAEERIVHLPTENQETIAIAMMQLRFEITRIRYFPVGPQSITIDKSYDALFPTQIIQIQVPAVQAGMIIDKHISDIIQVYSEYYVDKHI